MAVALAWGKSARWNVEEAIPAYLRGSLIFINRRGGCAAKECTEFLAAADVDSDRHVDSETSHREDASRASLRGITTLAHANI